MENISKTASNDGMSAKLHCRAVGAPMIRFSWERDGLNITSVSDKYIVEQKRVNITVILFKIYIYIYIIHIYYTWVLLNRKINIILDSTIFIYYIVSYPIDMLVAY